MNYESVLKGLHSAKLGKDDRRVDRDIETRGGLGILGERGNADRMRNERTDRQRDTIALVAHDDDGKEAPLNPP